MYGWGVPPEFTSLRFVRRNCTSLTLMGEHIITVSTHPLMVKSKKESLFWKLPCSEDIFSSIQIPNKQLTIHHVLRVVKLSSRNCCSKRSQQCKISQVDDRYPVLRCIESFQWIENSCKVFLNHDYECVFAFCVKKLHFFIFVCEKVVKVDKIHLTINGIKKKLKKKGFCEWKSVSF